MGLRIYGKCCAEPHGIQLAACQISGSTSVTLPQLRFTSFAVANSREDFHLQECARHGRTKKRPA